ncbi:uncharacterized protein Z518_01775 [Rhinocladiella mackenziei CBS 650.93]|uniref:Methyltransferase n=1 Tax=Rhinocladiella mackenziei CBS 650.93 TaxID=1442369 RepID=A0A0D2J4P5_9EURO|nr:uncharacterized protein Z518_01775 [Rhinocladiella mackenziei CBS 650.93]KIX10691.1 hypothetical protein Z518_01775 [Rhinocladiella mackenziei CBS 650.93]
MAAAAVQRHDVPTTLNFYKPNADGSPPKPAYLARPETFERPPESHQVTVHDVSGDENTYTLDSHGFQFVTSPSKERDFMDADRIEDVYYKEVEQLLKEVTGAARVHIFDHTIRRPSQKQANETRGNGAVVHDAEKHDPPPPSHVAFHLPKDAEKLLKGRVQLINVWRPIKTVRRDLLAVSPSQCFSEDDVVVVPVIYPHGNRTGAILSVKYTDRQRWYYKGHQTPEEVLIFKYFDNRVGTQSAKKYENRAKRVPHSAFEIPGAEREEDRESIEV